MTMNRVTYVCINDKSFFYFNFFCHIPRRFKVHIYLTFHPVNVKINIHDSKYIFRWFCFSHGTKADFHVTDTAFYHHDNIRCDFNAIVIRVHKLDWFFFVLWKLWLWKLNIRKAIVNMNKCTSFVFNYNLSATNNDIPSLHTQTTFPCILNYNNNNHVQQFQNITNVS